MAAAEAARAAKTVALNILVRFWGVGGVEVWKKRLVVFELFKKCELMPIEYRCPVYISHLNTNHFSLHTPSPLTYHKK